MPAARAARRSALALVLAACADGGAGPGLEVGAACDIVREPGNMVATVAGATLTVEAARGTDAATTVLVDLVDAGAVVDTASVEIGPLAEGERTELEVRFPAAPDGGWPTQADARCVARLAR